MKLKMTFSIAFVLGLATLSLMTSDSRAQPKQRCRAETGIIGPLGPDESLRITTVNRALESMTLNYEEIVYIGGSCDPNTGVCKHMAASQTFSGPIQLDRTQGASMLINSNNALRVIVTSNSQDAQVNAEIFKTSTGEVTAVWSMTDRCDGTLTK